MVGTKYCAWGKCKSDSRRQDEDDMRGVFFIPFVKPHIDMEKCKRWVNACRRVKFTINNVRKWTYICSKHFVGGAGPTIDHPDPVAATMSEQQVSLIGVSVHVTALILNLTCRFLYSIRLCLHVIVGGDSKYAIRFEIFLSEVLHIRYLV